MLQLLGLVSEKKYRKLEEKHFILVEKYWKLQDKLYRIKREMEGETEK